MQRAHVVSILKHAVVAGEGTSKLAALSGFRPLTSLICFL
jgi:hypothetical protein